MQAKPRQLVGICWLETYILAGLVWLIGLVWLAISTESWLHPTLLPPLPPSRTLLSRPWHPVQQHLAFLGSAEPIIPLKAARHCEHFDHVLRA